jgi:hypothetical protein
LHFLLVNYIPFVNIACLPYICNVTMQAQKSRAAGSPQVVLFCFITYSV